MPDISPEFYAALETGGTPSATCLCGRTHFATGLRNDLDLDELAEYRAAATTRPELYLEHPADDHIGIAEFAGVAYVVDCPCGRLVQLEELLWKERERLVGYYKARLARELAEAQAGLATAVDL